MKFAWAENETWGNNATYQFLQLFHVYLPGTQASLLERYKFLNDVYQPYNQEKLDLIIQALGSGLKVRYFGRAGAPTGQISSDIRRGPAFLL